MKMHTADSQSTDKPAEARGRDVAKRRGFTLLRETERDQVAAAGSNPGCVGDGRQSMSQFPKTR